MKKTTKIFRATALLVLIAMLSIGFISCNQGIIDSNPFSEYTENNEIPEENRIICKDDYSLDKITFSSDGKTISFPKYKDVESVIGYSPEIQNNMRWFRRFYAVLNVNWAEGKDIGDVQPNGSQNGKITWLLYVADFLNLYQEKVPSMLDMTNAPKWLTDLMEHRKTLSKTYAKSDYELDVAKLYFEAEEGDAKIKLKWCLPSIVKRFSVFKQEISGSYTEITGIAQNATEYTVSGLENMKNYKFKIYFYDKDDRFISRIKLTAMPYSGTDSDYETDPNNFTEENANKFLKEHKIDFKIDDDSTSIHFEEDSSGNKKIVIPRYRPEEAAFSYSADEIEFLNDTDSGDVFWDRLKKVLDYKGNPSAIACWEANNGKGNVRYLLYLADFVNIYNKKASAMVDITKAPEWFKTLMTTRSKIDKDSDYIKNEFQE